MVNIKDPGNCRLIRLLIIFSKLFEKNGKLLYQSIN